jgi:hypothetical protein
MNDLKVSKRWGDQTANSWDMVSWIVNWVRFHESELVRMIGERELAHEIWYDLPSR